MGIFGIDASVKVVVYYIYEHMFYRQGTAGEWEKNVYEYDGI